MEAYSEILTFFEDENINVSKAIQDAKCNPFRAVNFHES